MNRQILTFAKRAIAKNNTLKTKMSMATFILALCFLLMTFAYMWSFFTNYWLGSEMYDSKHNNILLINTPDSFIDYMEEKGEGGRLLDERMSQSHEEIAPYDMVGISNLMEKRGAFMAIYFPENFDELLEAHDSDNVPEILTYAKADLLTHSEWADAFTTNLFENEYRSFLADRYGYTVLDDDFPFEFIEEPTTPHMPSEFDSSVSTIIPLIIFILTLYIAMSTGTNVIAGEKEKGTFLGILMTPVKRSDIIIGDFLGCFIAAFAPGLIITIFAGVSSSTYYYYGNAVPYVILAALLVLSLAAFVTSLTILISTMNRTVVQAQTAFLPVFLILLVICLTCIQNIGTSAAYYYIFPVYGQFYGIGYCLSQTHIIPYEANMILPLILCILITLGLTMFILFVSTKTIGAERFVTTSEGITIKEIKKAKKKSGRFVIPWGYLIDQAVFPLVVLSIFQLLSMIPAVITAMTNADYSDFILSLKDIDTMSEVFEVMGSILAVFLTSPVFLFSMGIGYILLMATYALRIRIQEYSKTPLKSLGLKKEHALRDYLIGLVIGFSCMTCIYFFLIATSNISTSGIALKSSQVPILLISIFMWLFQGAAEEVMFRGYMMNRVASKTNMSFAIIFSSILFAFLHGANIGFTVLAGINLFLVAVLFALIYLATDSLWVTCAAHTAWNFCQGTLYGLEVSGSASSLKILNTSYSASYNPIFTGGAFGPEGGIGVTLVAIIGITLVLILNRKKNILRR